MRRMARMLAVTAMALLVSAAGAVGGQVYFYHTDPAGTPIAMSDASGNVVWRADYRPFGEIQSETGTAENNKLFVGKEKDDETGFFYFGARYMDDRIGRFISPDPVGAVDPKTGKITKKVLLNPQGLNVYAYALNNPYRYMDPDGQIWETVRQNRLPYIVGNTLIMILMRGTEQSARGMDPTQPFSHPAEYVGTKQDLIQEWHHDPENPERDAEYPYGTKRTVEQTYGPTMPRPGEALWSDERRDGVLYEWKPQVPDRTYVHVPSATIEYPPPTRPISEFNNRSTPRLERRRKGITE